MAAAAFALEPRREVCSTGASALFGMRSTVGEGSGGGEGLQLCALVVLDGAGCGDAFTTLGRRRRRRGSIDSKGSTPATGTLDREGFSRLGMTDHRWQPPGAPSNSA